MKKYSKLIILNVFLLLLGGCSSTKMSHQEIKKAQKATDKQEQVKQSVIPDALVKKTNEIENERKESLRASQQKVEQRRLNQVDFGDGVQFNTTDGATVKIYVNEVTNIPFEDPRVSSYASKISDVGQFVQVEYTVHVLEGEFSFNHLIFNYLDEKDEEGALMEEDLEKKYLLTEGKAKTTAGIVAFKNYSEKVSVKVGNATFKGEVE